MLLGSAFVVLLTMEVLSILFACESSLLRISLSSSSAVPLERDPGTRIMSGHGTLHSGILHQKSESKDFMHDLEEALMPSRITFIPTAKLL